MLIDRRLFVGGSMLSLFSHPCYARERRNIYDDALIAAFPLYETARLAMASPNGFNRLGHRRALSDHTARAVTMPNNDTLYSACWLDLTTGPVDLDIPALAGRYMSVALMSAFTDNIAVLRAPGGDAPALRARIVGPGWDGENREGRQLVRMPSSYGWLLARTFVEGADDLPSARAAQDRLSFVASNQKPSQLQLMPKAPTLPGGKIFLRVVNGAVAALDQRNSLARNLRQYAKIGIGGAQVETWDALGAEKQAGWARALTKLADASMAKMEDHATPHASWNWPDANIGVFGNDYAFRAATALSGIGALPQNEAIYLRAISDAKGRPLSADMRYRLTLPPTAEIANAFWSLSAYRGEADGRYFFEDNELHRFAINSASRGLETDQNGHVSLIIQKERPAGATANWLPLPTENPALVLRLYLPTKALMRNRGLIPVLDNVV
jgi:hypothetical protein